MRSKNIKQIQNLALKSGPALSAESTVDVPEQIRMPCFQSIWYQVSCENGCRSFQRLGHCRATE